MRDIREYKQVLLELLGKKASPRQSPAEADPTALALMEALGGKDNIFSLDACLTRLRVEVKVLGLVNHDKLQKLGALGVVIVGHEVQAIFGKRSDSLRQDLERWFGLDHLAP
ncbi:glucose PTS transporter subunit EIIB [Pseudaeromonas sharmana]|uniref:Glucose PTS transporter subunit EIIB n=1 Tax=Pseudaeromonas sharmana TaxID=328412 RepID=A0ABV8CIA3_9GAMM